MDVENILELRGVNKTYNLQSQENVIALQNINLDVKIHTLTLITGPSGSGKSSLLKVAGLLENPSEGDVLFKGSNIKDMGPDERNRTIRNEVGLVVPYPNLLPYLSILENVILPMKHPERNKALELLEKVGFPLSHADIFPDYLYLKEQQRASLARALSNKPTMVLLDEPCYNLTPADTQDFMELLHYLKEEYTIMVFSDDSTLSRYADRIFKLEND